jgi:gamma-D-glutamyl-L-lysine dipeptidyl-peptidase
MNQIYGVCNLSLVPLRAEASDKSEMTSQLLFGDHFKVLEQTEKWVRIQTAFDDYQGWIDNKQFLAVKKETYDQSNALQALTGLQVYHPVMKQHSREMLRLVAGSSLPVYNGSDCTLEGDVYKLSDIGFEPDPAKFYDQVVESAKFYLHTPYLWGGRSVFGIDCSGFSQMVYKLCGVALKRDAWQQAMQGETVDFIQEARAGDLAFFDNEEGRIIHVGIMLADQQIIHASGKVKIDRIDSQGIYSADLQRYTHKLRIIKRLV